MSILAKSFGLVDMTRFDANAPKLMSLSRSVANELVLLSVLVPLCVADLGAEFSQKVYSTDASLAKGAIVSTEVSPQVSQVLWRSSRSKGGYSKLLTPVQSVLARCLDFEEEDETASGGITSAVDRPLAFRFDFVEVFAGAASVTKEMAALGYSVCCPIELSVDLELDVTKSYVFEWLSYLVTSRLIKALMVEPPCTTFSIMRRPRLRSRDFPFGFDPRCPAAMLGNLLGYRAPQLLFLAIRYGVPCLFENPWSSMIKYLPAWKIVRRQGRCILVRVDSCAYGSPHLKAFGILGAWVSARWISKRCDRTHSHIQVQGKYTKASASYVPLLAKAFARTLADAIVGMGSSLSFDSLTVASGLENQLVNDLAISMPWSLVAVWTFGRPAHINILELSCVLRLATRLAKSGKPLRVVVLVDSNVVKCAASKGRSSSKALSRLLSKLAAVCVVSGLYLSFAFVPTRLNPSDDPTRDAVLRSPRPGLGLDSWTSEDLYQLAQFQGLRRWAANWCRLVLRLCGPGVFGWSDPSLYRRPCFPLGLPASSADPHCPMDFDSTLGFPGEGPGWPGHLFCFGLPLKPWMIFVSLLCLSHGMLHPKTPGDVARQAERSLRPPLQEGRPVLGITQKLRSSHLDLFQRWFAGQGVSLDDLLDGYMTRAEEINRLLVKFGRALYAVGRPYNHYAETINAVASRKPVLRRQLQEAWNLAFAWVRDEPSVHHLAMPWQVLLSAISTCIAWGWMDIAGMLALTWGALLRVGEFLSAFRKDLLLPVDTSYTNQFALLSLKEPKTRFSAARHQSAKLDIPDLLRVVHLAFAGLSPLQKLWPMSGQTLRNRFKLVMNAIGLTADIKLNGKNLDLGSLRAGGATWMLQATEDGEFCRRRGRWINQRVMEIYIQEISSFQLLAILPMSVRTKVYTMAAAFPELLKFASTCTDAKIPHKSWRILWNAQDSWK